MGVLLTRWHVYVLRCRDGSLYTGITNDLKARLAAHNRGTASRYTRSRLPVTLLWSRRCGGRSQALRREWSIKQLDRRGKLLLIAKAPKPLV